MRVMFEDVWVLDLLLPYLGPGDILNLSATCSYINHLVKSLWGSTSVCRRFANLYPVSCGWDGSVIVEKPLYGPHVDLLGLNKPALFLVTENENFIVFNDIHTGKEIGKISFNVHNTLFRVGKYMTVIFDGALQLVRVYDNKSNSSNNSDRRICCDTKSNSDSKCSNESGKF